MASVAIRTTSFGVGHLVKLDGKCLLFDPHLEDAPRTLVHPDHSAWQINWERSEGSAAFSSSTIPPPHVVMASGLDHSQVSHFRALQSKMADTVLFAPSKPDLSMLTVKAYHPVDQTSGKAFCLPELNLKIWTWVGYGHYVIYLVQNTETQRTVCYAPHGLTPAEMEAVGSTTGRIDIYLTAVRLFALTTCPFNRSFVNFITNPVEAVQVIAKAARDFRCKYVLPLDDQFENPNVTFKGLVNCLSNYELIGEWSKIVDDVRNGPACDDLTMICAAPGDPVPLE
ncbi:hypothetical protein PBRA_005441 [Plasmodiophora brassicae]|nr:hypothetical protein PBRA_005441 [Plasmodiophora brassicae]